MKRRLMFLNAALAAALVMAGAGCGSAPHQSQEGAPEPEPQVTHCSVDRWAVKTLTDPGASRVNLTPTTTTVEELAALPVPDGFSSYTPRLEPEFQTYTVSAILAEFKEEADSDIRLVLLGVSGQAMIAEIPAPDCALGSRVQAQIAAARKQFNAQFGQADRSRQQPMEHIRVTGVLFFDAQHGETGVAPNAIELHPVIGVEP
jgi:hypothetical protein